MSTPDDRIAKAFENHKVWLYEPVKNDWHVITHVKVFLSYDDIPLLDAAAELVPPDPAVVEEYWRQPTPSEIKRGLNWEEMNDPPGFMRPEYAQRKELSEWAWAVLDREALEAEGLEKWRAMRTPGLIAESDRVEPLGYPDEGEDLEAEVTRLKAENAALREKLAQADIPQPLPPNPSETKLSEYGQVGEPSQPPQALRELMEDGETIGQAKIRLWPILNNELAELKNKEALFGQSLPRRAEVESLIGVLAMVGDA